MEKKIQDMKRTADEFLEISHNPNTFIPNFANAGFACELYLKIISQYITKKYVRSHDLRILDDSVLKNREFNEVEFLNILTLKYNENFKDANFSDDCTKVCLQHLLDVHRNVFEDMRYYFDLPEEDDVEQFFELIKLLKDFALKNKSNGSITIADFADKLKDFVQKRKKINLIKPALTRFAETLKASNSNHQYVDLSYLESELDKIRKSLKQKYINKEKFLLDNQTLPTIELKCKLYDEHMNIPTFFEFFGNYGKRNKDFTHFVLVEFGGALDEFKLIRPIKGSVNLMINVFAYGLKKYVEEFVTDI